MKGRWAGMQAYRAWSRIALETTCGKCEQGAGYTDYFYGTYSVAILLTLLE
jgi:hypothetical protein